MDDKQKEYLKNKGKLVREQNRNFRHKINQLYAKKYRYSLRFEDALLSDDGKAYINVDLTNIDSPFSIFSYDRRLNQEIYDYIDNEAFYLRASIPIVINFDDGNRYSQELKDRIRKTVIRHYSLQYEDNRLEWKKTLLFGFLLLGIGLGALLTYILLSIFVLGPKEIDRIYIEIICIISWVFIWQSVDHFFFTGHDKRINIYNAGQLALAEVRFGEPVIKK